jgi:hypothetical protein
MPEVFVLSLRVSLYFLFFLHYSAHIALKLRGNRLAQQLLSSTGCFFLSVRVALKL